MREIRLAMTVAETKSGDWLVADVDGVFIVKKGTSKVVAEFPSQGFSCVRLNAEGTLLAAATYKQVLLFSVPGFRRLWEAKSPFFESRELWFAKDGLWHFARTGCERLDLKTGRQKETRTKPLRVTEVRADGKWELGPAGVGAPRKKRITFQFELARFLPNGDVFAADGSSGRLELLVVEAATGTVKRRAVGPKIGLRKLAHLSISPSGAKAVVTVEEGIAVIDVDSLSIEVRRNRTAQLGYVTSDDQTLLVLSTKFEKHALKR